MSRNGQTARNRARAVLAGLLLLAVAPSSQPRPVAPLLVQLRLQADPDANIFLNDRRAALLRDRLAAAGSPVQEMILRVELSWELLWAGRPREAIEQARQVRQVTRDWPVPPDSPVNLSLEQLLALAYLRLGEQENCLALHSPDACLLPLQGGALHRRREGSEQALVHLGRLLQLQPEHLGYRWLLNLAHMTLGGYPEQVPEPWRIPPRVFADDGRLPRFSNRAHALGLDVEGLAGGSILEDFDRDGDLDLMASSWGLADPLRYFRNDGNGGFGDWTARAGLQGQVGGLNLLQADYDNDGYADVLVLRGGWLGYLGPGEGDHPNTLLRNRGDGTFEDVTEAAGVLDFHPAQTASWADYDRDG